MSLNKEEETIPWKGWSTRKEEKGRANQLKEKRVLKGVGVGRKDKEIQSVKVMEGPICPKKDITSIFI